MEGSNADHSGQGLAERPPEHFDDSGADDDTPRLARALAHALPDEPRDVAALLASLTKVHEAYRAVAETAKAVQVLHKRPVAAGLDPLLHRVLEEAIQRLGQALLDVGIHPRPPSEAAGQGPASARHRTPVVRDEQSPAAASPASPVETPGEMEPPLSPPHAPLQLRCGQCEDDVLHAPDPTKPPGKQHLVRMYCSCWKGKDPDDLEFVDHHRTFKAKTNPRLRFKVLQGEGKPCDKPRLRTMLSVIRFRPKR